MVCSTPAVILAALCAGACSTAIAPHGAMLHIASDPPGATVLDSAGRTLGITPLHATLGRFSLVAPGYDTTVVIVGQRPASFRVQVALQRLEEPLVVPPPPVPERLTDREAAVVFAAFAEGAARAGCEPLLVDAWRDAAQALDPAHSASPRTELRALAEEEVARVDSTLRRLCAHPGPLVERLRRIRLGEVPATPVEGTAELLAPVYFGFGEWTVGDDSVRARLRALGRRLAASPMPVRLTVEGFADPAGDPARNDAIALRRAHAVINELLLGGAPPACCVAASRGSSAPAVAGAAGNAPGARLNRRVTFSLDYREAP
jgi:outer membrane protein OmpA-like peptidoglycan-associated protein